MAAGRHGWRVPPPAATDLVRWPAGFGPRFVVIADVEEEFDWGAAFDPRHRSMTAIHALPAAARRLGEAGAPLACMVDHPAATDPAAIAALTAVAADPRVTIGAQLHPWVTPPHREALCPFNSFVGNLPPALEAAKIDAIGDAIATAFGQRPWAFRAGRYGIGPRSRALLAARGYTMDLSVRAYHGDAGQGGPDFTRVGTAAYHVDGVIECPATTVFTGALRRIGPTLYRAATRVPRGPGVLARTGLLSRITLTPEGMPVAEALRAIDAALADGEPLLILSFHSPSLVPGHTPYVRDAADLAAFWRWWDAVLALLARRGVAGAALAEVAVAARGGR